MFNIDTTTATALIANYARGTTRLGEVKLKGLKKYQLRKMVEGEPSAKGHKVILRTGVKVRVIHL